MLDDYPRLEGRGPLSDLSLRELRNIFKEYARLDPSYEEAFNNALKTFLERESVYVQVFGKLAALEDARESLLAGKPDALVTEGRDSLTTTLQIMGLTAVGSFMVKLVSMGDNLVDIRNNSRRLKDADTIVTGTKAKLAGPGTGARRIVFAHNHTEAQRLAKQQRKLKLKAGLAGLAIVGAGVILFKQMQANRELKEDLVDALPMYETWFETTEDQTQDLLDATDDMNSQVAQVVASTGAGTEANLLSYLTASLGEVGQFEALVDSAEAMLRDGLSADKVSLYTRLPLDFVQQLEGQI